MNVRLIDESKMSCRLDRSIRASLRICFPRDAEALAKSRAWHGSTPAWSVILEEGATVIAHVGVVDRTVRVGVAPVRVAGIQNVCVVPQHRGGFLSGRLLVAAADEARQRGIDFGLLFCAAPLVRVYRRCQWQVLPAARVTRVDQDGRELPLPDGNIPMVLRLGQSSWPAGAIHLMGNDW